MSTIEPMNVGVVGLGRAGWGLHVHTMLQAAVSPKFKIVAAADPIKARQEEAANTLGCRTYDDIEPLLGDREVELVVVATFNNLHAPHSIAALKAGKNVLCEKPMATSLADADRMVATAKESGRILTFDHEMRFLPSLLQVKHIIDSGKIGEPLLIHINGHFFRRRWDWQTLKSFGGGEMNNNACHAVDEALFLMGDVEPEVFADVRRTPLIAGDADDHVKIILRARGAPTCDIEITNASAIKNDEWHVMGTRGGIAGSWSELRIRWFNPDMLGPREAVGAPTPDRSYYSEKLPWQEETWNGAGAGTAGYEGVYLSLYETLRHGKPLAITPESVRRVIAVLEECRRQSPVYNPALS